MRIVASCAATDSQKINRLRHRARRAFLSSEATSLPALTSLCWLCKCLAAFATALKRDAFRVSGIFPPYAKRNGVGNIGFHYKKSDAPRAPVRDTVASWSKRNTFVEEPPSSVRTRPQHATARQLLMSWKDADRAWVHKATSLRRAASELLCELKNCDAAARSY